MKKVLIVLLLLPLLSIAQADTQLKDAIVYMRDNLDSCHREFKTGVLIAVGGIGVAALGAAWKADPGKTNYEGAKDFKNTAMILGGIAILFGELVIIDSHKFIGRAGRWKFMGDSITFKF